MCSQSKHCTNIITCIPPFKKFVHYFFIYRVWIIYYPKKQIKNSNDFGNFCSPAKIVKFSTIFQHVIMKSAEITKIIQFRSVIPFWTFTKWISILTYIWQKIISKTMKRLVRIFRSEIIIFLAHYAWKLLLDFLPHTCFRSAESNCSFLISISVNKYNYCVVTTTITKNYFSLQWYSFYRSWTF